MKSNEEKEELVVWLDAAEQSDIIKWLNRVGTQGLIDYIRPTIKTCKMIEIEGKMFCSECNTIYIGFSDCTVDEDDAHLSYDYNFCRNCGAMVVEGKTPQDLLD